MRKILFIVVINFLIYHGATEILLSSRLNAFLSCFGLGTTAENKVIPTVPDTVPDTALDIAPETAPDENHKTERIYQPLELIFISMDGNELMAAIGNPMHLRQDIRDGEFVDAEFACPKKEDEKDAKLAKVSQLQTLVIEKSYISLVDKYIKEANELKETIDDAKEEDDENQEQHPNQDTVSRKKHVEKEDKSELTSMEQRKEKFVAVSSPDDRDISLEELSRQKLERKNPLGHIPEKHGAVPEPDESDIKEPETTAPIQKTDAVPIQTGSDSASDQKSSVTNLSKTSSLKSEEPVKLKIRRSKESFTYETKDYWFKAVKDVENFKCETPIRPLLVQYSSSSLYTIYIAGFDVYLANHDNLKFEEFRNEPNRNRKYTFFWSFTVVFNHSDHSLCVYHEVQYNTDTFNPKINDNFDNHDLGKDEMFPKLDMNQLYGLKHQEKVFGKLFKKEDERKKYFDIEEGRFLEKLHLAPLHGFISPVVRQSAKTYGNVAVMWKSIKTGAWSRLEEQVNVLSSILMDVVVITGSYGTLKLNGKEVFLADDPKIPVPLLFWKMVIYQNDLQKFPGIVFVTSNNPYEEIDNIICLQDKCRLFGWGYVREDDLTKGRTICCDFNPYVLSKLPILNGAQPSSVLNWTTIGLFAENLWDFDEKGRRMTQWKFDKILKRFTHGRNLVEEMIEEEEKAKERAENENAENEDPNKIEETVPLLTELEKVTFPNKRVQIK